MRKINYETKAANGTTFVTADYIAATSNGCTVVKTFFTEVEDPADTKAVNDLVKFWERCAK